MSNVVFDEEQNLMNKDSEIASVRRPGGGVLNSVSAPKATAEQNSMMILFACVCFIIAFGVWYYQGGFRSEPTFYQEDIGPQQLKLIPEKDRQQFINSLPSRAK